MGVRGPRGGENREEAFTIVQKEIRRGWTEEELLEVREGNRPGDISK